MSAPTLAWTCELHGITTTGDCPRCDDELIAMTDDLVDEFEESRPADLDDCGRCEGQGMFIDVVDGEPGWQVCGWCAGTGRRGVL